MKLFDQIAAIWTAEDKRRLETVEDYVAAAVADEELVPADVAVAIRDADWTPGMFEDAVERQKTVNQLSPIVARREEVQSQLSAIGDRRDEITAEFRKVEATFSKRYTALDAEADQLQTEFLEITAAEEQLRMLTGPSAARREELDAQRRGLVNTQENLDGLVGRLEQKRQQLTNLVDRLGQSEPSSGTEVSAVLELREVERDLEAARKRQEANSAQLAAIA